MKLFRTAFWLGVVIYNLPSPDSQPAAPESPLAVKAHRRTVQKTLIRTQNVAIWSHMVLPAMP